MPLQTTYSELRGDLASYLDRITEDQEVVIVRSRNRPDVAMLPASELSSILETAHLLRSPRNAQRLGDALQWSKRRKSKHMTVAEIRREFRLERE